MFRIAFSGVSWTPVPVTSGHWFWFLLDTRSDFIRSGNPFLSGQWFRRLPDTCSGSLWTVLHRFFEDSIYSISYNERTTLSWKEMNLWRGGYPWKTSKRSCGCLRGALCLTGRSQRAADAHQVLSRPFLNGPDRLPHHSNSLSNKMDNIPSGR